MGTLTEVFSNFLLFFLVFGMSATVDIDKLRKQLRNKHALLTGVSMQFLILPFVGFVVVKLFGFSAPVGITLLVVTSSPGGSYSNWWCSLFNAELALSVTMTALSTMVSVVMLPVNLIIYASGSYSSAVVKSLDWYALFMSLFVVIGGISSGLFCSAYFKDSQNAKKMRKAANRFGNLSGMCLVAYSILVSSSDHKAALWDQSWDFFVGLAIPAVVGITAATLLATRFNLEKPERVAVAVESCYQNTGIATSVAAVMFDTTEDDLATALSVTVYYGMVEMFLLATFCVICWKSGWTKAPSDEKFCVVISTSYEVGQGEGEDQSIDVVLGGISRSEDEDDDCEKAKDVVGPPKPPLIFEESDATEDESECSGAVVLRKVDTTETICTEGSDPLSPPREPRDVAGSISSENSPSPSNQLSVSEAEIVSSPSRSLSGSISDEGDQEQQLDGDGKDTGQVGRFGKTISFVKARATGYRRAPLPMGDSDGEDDQIITSPVRRGTGYQRAPLPNVDSDGEDDQIISTSQSEPETGIPESGEIADLEACRRNSRTHSLSPKASTRTVDRVPEPVECPSPPLSSRTQDESEATPADGKTID